LSNRAYGIGASSGCKIKHKGADLDASKVVTYRRMIVYTTLVLKFTIAEEDQPCRRLTIDNPQTHKSLHFYIDVEHDLEEYSAQFSADRCSTSLTFSWRGRWFILGIWIHDPYGR
jgi:hypothetical protein